MGQILGRGGQVVNGWKSRKIEYRLGLIRMIHTGDR